MSLPNYLAKIKSSGMYRYVFDKSAVPSQDAETLRLVVGYSEKGPFNTPVYIDNKADFINLYGNINKRLERKGVFFHRMALQALNAGPILVLNIKPFTAAAAANESGDGTVESVAIAAFNPWDNWDASALPIGALNVVDAYDTNRFWTINPDSLPKKIETKSPVLKGKYINMMATDVKDMSCSFFTRPYRPSEYDITISDWYANQSDLEMPSYLEGYEDRKLNEFFAEIYVFRGEFTEALCKGTLKTYFDGTEWNKLNPNYTNIFNEEADALEYLSYDPNSKFIAKYQGCLLPYFTDANGNYVSLDILFNNDTNTHKMIMKLNEDLVDEMLADHFESVSTSNTSLIYGDNNTSYEYWNATHPAYLSGYVYNTIAKTTSAEDLQDVIFGTSGINSKGIRTALTNNVDCEYHYIVDTFASYLGKMGKHCKKALASIAKDKGNSFAILNTPAMSEFINNTSYSNNSGFDITKLPNYIDIFSLPLDTDGASFCAFYTPVILSNGVVKTTCPSAALVSNNFMEKWTSRQPYYIVAGPNHGKITAEGLVGPDYNYSRADLDILEPMGINVIIYVPRKGTYINSNQTAKQTPVTALSKVHVRELVIYLQNEIEKMLQNYQWELNTSVLRDTVKTKADTILERIAANGGVYAYLNVCDESNNGPEVIDNEMIILDTSIEPARGAGKMVQRLTIHKTGGISSLVK